MCLISHKYKFIFIRVRKTASTSMHVALSKFCGPLDIVTHIGDRDQLHSKAEQNNWSYLPSKTPVFYNHIPAFRIREMIAEMDTSIWDDYFKFCFERNPWDKAISLYYFHNQDGPWSRKELNKFIMHEGNFPKTREWVSYTDEDQKNIIVNKVFKYEKMDEAFKYLKKRLNLPSDVKMPEKRFKGWMRKDHRHYREVLTNEERERIAEVYNKEIKEFVYEY